MATVAQRALAWFRPDVAPAVAPQAVAGTTNNNGKPKLAKAVVATALGTLTFIVVYLMTANSQVSTISLVATTGIVNGELLGGPTVDRAVNATSATFNLRSRIISAPIALLAWATAAASCRFSCASVATLVFHFLLPGTALFFCRVQRLPYRS